MTVVSETLLPSYERMDSVYLLETGTASKAILVETLNSESVGTEKAETKAVEADSNGTETKKK